MACWSPLTAYHSKEINLATGKRPLTFNLLQAHTGIAIKLLCGQCIGCRDARALEWGIRGRHEASLWPANCFITLTYSDEAIPVSYSVYKRHLQLFNMRLREFYGAGIRHLGCGEYSPFPALRPHYHELLFNHDFPDKKLWRTRDRYRIFKSDKLHDLWPHGHHEIGSVTIQSARYVGRHNAEKITGKMADGHYWRQSPIDGQSYRVEPEFLLVSNQPGLGHDWFQRYKSDYFPDDFVVIDGRKYQVPGYYLRKLAEVTQADAEVIKRKRKALAATPAQRWNRTKERLAVRAELHAIKRRRATRSLS